MTAMILIFAGIYSRTIAKEGFLYQDTIFTPGQEDDSLVYSGKIHGEPARFTVSPDKTVTFQYSSKTYGPYTAKKAPDAVSKEEDPQSMTGIEFFRGEELLFRGGVQDYGDRRFLYNEDGSLEDTGISVTVSNGVVMEENGTVLDPMEPSILTILDLMAGPQLTHKGDWVPWFGGVFVCIITAISILFADELFRWNLSFQIRDADLAEPSELEIAGRYIAWTVLPIAALILLLTGLQ